MCGINGSFAYAPDAPPVDAGELQRSRDRMTPRGPDGAGLWVADDQRIGLAHRRLAILDLSERGRQPMADADGRTLISYNGEIYNFRELRRDLAAAGVRFRSDTDTEVLLELYRRDGPAMVDRLRGMFAFALWDAAKGELFLARDPYGIKPLYYADDGKTLRFASQISALDAGGAVAMDIDPAGMVGFLLWGSVPEPLTLHRHIRLLPAGTTLRITGQGVGSPRSYWNIGDALRKAVETARDQDRALVDEAAFAAAKEALGDSVRAHMVADVPVGAFLSAGLDSATITGLAQACSDHPIQTITLTFDEFEDHHLDEAPLAGEIARHLGVAHHCIRIGMDEFEAEFPRFLDAMDQPTIDGINTWLVSRGAAQAGLKVVLSGLGGDELLGGYATFREVPALAARMGPWSRVPGLGRAYRHLYRGLIAPFTKAPSAAAGVLEYGGSLGGAYRLQRGVFMPWELPELMDPALIRSGLEGLGDIDPPHPASDRSPPDADASMTDFARVIELESTRYMRNQLLRDTDWIGMAHSLEIRVPLVDRVLTERIAGLAALGRLGEGKRVLPQSLDQGLPDAVLNKPKTGFTVPVWKWLRKSPLLDAWKANAYLRRPQIQDTCRTAYSLLKLRDDTRELLR